MKNQFWEWKTVADFDYTLVNDSVRISPKNETIDHVKKKGFKAKTVRTAFLAFLSNNI